MAISKSLKYIYLKTTKLFVNTYLKYSRKASLFINNCVLNFFLLSFLYKFEKYILKVLLKISF